MKRTVCTVLALALLNGPAAMAQPGYPDRSQQRDYRAEQGGPRYSRGDRLPSQYRQNLHVVNDSTPPRPSPSAHAGGTPPAC